MKLDARFRQALRDLRARLSPPRYYVATFGDYGLQVEFYRSHRDYVFAIAEAEENHSADRVDTYTHGEIAQ